MLVQCPKCKTTYRVSDEVVKGPSPAFRCSRCKHTFEIEVERQSTPDASGTSRGVSDQSRELAFPFEPDTRAGPTPPPYNTPLPVQSAAVPKPSAVSEIESRHGEPQTNDKDEPFAGPMSAADARHPTEDNPRPNPPTEGTPVHFASLSRETNDNVFAIEPYREQPASVAPFLTLFGLLLVFFSFALAYSQTHPAASVGWVRAIPLLGPSVVRNDHLKNGVLLKSIETKFQTLQGSRDVLVITGLAVNQNPVLIRNVQVMGRLYDQEGKQIEQQSMWIGNAISSQIIRGMTAQDVTDLQRLKPLKTFEIPPGDSVTFAIVFLRTGKQVADARCEVVSAEGNV